MKVLIACATALIAFSLADQALFGGKIVPGGVVLARVIASSFGF